MDIGGTWDPRVDTMLGEVSVACGNIESQLRRLPGGQVRTAISQLYNDLSAVFGTLVDLCRGKQRCSSQVGAAILRTLLESALSVFAFCKGSKIRERRARLYLNYAAVYDFRLACIDEKNLGCPWVADDSVTRKSIAQRKHDARTLLLQFGADFLERKPKSGESYQALLEVALRPGQEKPNWFLSTWYPQSRKQILEREGMAWVNDVLYKRLCSAIHSDICASKILAGIGRDNLAIIALEVWGAAVYRLVEEFSINLPADHKAVFRTLYGNMRG